LKLVTILKFFLTYTFTKTIGKFVYKKQYLTGKYFKPYAIGWSWVVKCFFWQKILGFNKNVPWPVSPKVTIGNWKNIVFHPDDLHIFHTFGTYFQGYGGKVIIGKGSYIAPNVGLITSNHDVLNLENHVKGEDIVIGEKCWIGMNSVILPGVKLGPNTIVAAGAVVSKSFPDGFCIVGGVPAKVIKSIENGKEVED
jgi:hypothetical protein